MILIVLLPFAFTLFASILALPASAEPTKDVDFHAFPEFAGFDDIDQLLGNDTESDIEERDPAAAQAGPCTLAPIKKIMFDYSESFFLPCPPLNMCTSKAPHEHVSQPRHGRIPIRPQRQIPQLLRLVLQRMHSQPGPTPGLQFHPAVPAPRFRRYELFQKEAVEPCQQVEDRLEIPHGYVGCLRQVDGVEECAQEGDVYGCGE